MQTKSKTALVLWPILIICNLALIVVSLQKLPFFADEVTVAIESREKSEADKQLSVEREAKKEDKQKVVKLKEIKPVPAAPITPKAPEESEPRKQQQSQIAKKKKVTKEQKGEPLWTGQIDPMSAYDFEQMIRDYQGALIVFNTTKNKATRQIRKGTSVSIANLDLTRLHIVAHDVTDDLETQAVRSWLQEASRSDPSSNFRIYAKLSAYHQEQLHSLAKQKAQEIGKRYMQIDRVKIRFSKQGIEINAFEIEGKSIAIKEILSS